MHLTSGNSQTPMTIDMRAPNYARIPFIAVGAFIIVITIWELGRVVWPVNIFSLFFLFIILGAISVGGPILTGATFGMNDLWTIEKDRLTIDRQNWFRTEKLVFTPEQIDQFNVVEIEAMEGDNTFRVVVWVRGWKSFQTYDLRTKAAAEKMRDEIIAALQGNAAN